MSMLLASSTVSFYLYIETKRRKFIALPVFAAVWFIILITRGFFIGIVLQSSFLLLSVRKVRGSTMVKMGVAVLSLILLFGVVGDLRSGGGSDLVRGVAHPTERFPDWLPSGFLWVYLYLASPLNNLFHTILLKPTVEDFSITVTTAALFPTVIRTVIFPDSAMKQGDLVDTNLNMGTGFLGPYLDMGILGVTIFSFFIGAVAGLFWNLRRKRFFLLGYAFVAHSMALSVFYDEILFLPFLFQLVWFWYVLRGSSKQGLLALSAQH
jgi:oligosaccharide repeat unit polymerase